MWLKPSSLWSVRDVCLYRVDKQYIYIIIKRQRTQLDVLCKGKRSVQNGGIPTVAEPTFSVKISELFCNPCIALRKADLIDHKERKTNSRQGTPTFGLFAVIHRRICKSKAEKATVFEPGVRPSVVFSQAVNTLLVKRTGSNRWTHVIAFN